MRLDLNQASRLAAAINRSRLHLRFQREGRRELAIEAAGDRFSEYTQRLKKPVNLLGMFQSTMARSLVAKTPRFMLSAKREQYRPVVSAMQSWINQEVERTKLADTLQKIVIDALYLVGIAKIAIATPCDAAMKAWRQEAGKPMLQRIDFDDFVYSTDAQDFSDCDFIGHRYRCPLDVAKKLYKAHADEIQATEQIDYNQEGDERIGKMIRGDYGSSEFEEHTELCEVYLPRHRKIVVFSGLQVEHARDDGQAVALWEQDWIGPDSGPYEFLSLIPVVGSALGKGPMMDLYHLDRDTNASFRKADRMIRRLKEITTYRKGNDQDATALRDAKDGDVVGFDDPKAIGNIVTGGQAVQVVMAIAEAFRKLFSSMGGNLELLNGTAPQSRTAHQDQMLNENAGMSVADYQEKTIAFTSRCGEKLCWFHHHDPISIQEVSQQVPGMPEMQIERKIYPWSYPDNNVLKRSQRFEDMNIRVDPHSIRYQSPQQRQGLLDQMMMQIITPLMPILQQQGWQPDMGEYLRIKSELSDFPDLERVMGMGEPVTQDEGSEMPHDRTLPVATSREYTRRSQSGPPQDQQIQSSMLNAMPGGSPSSNGSGLPGLIGS